MLDEIGENEKMDIDKISGQFINGIAKANDYLAKTHLPWWGKIIAAVFLIGLTLVFASSCTSILIEFVVSSGATDHNKVEIFARTFFNVTLMTTIYTLLRLLIDKNKSGIPDVLEKEEHDNGHNL